MRNGWIESRDFCCWIRGASWRSRRLSWTICLIHIYIPNRITQSFVLELRTCYEKIIRNSHSKTELIKIHRVNQREQFVLKEPFVVISLVNVDRSRLNSYFIIKGGTYNQPVSVHINTSPKVVIIFTIAWRYSCLLVPHTI